MILVHCPKKHSLRSTRAFVFIFLILNKMFWLKKEEVEKCFSHRRSILAYMTFCFWFYLSPKVISFKA